MLAHEVIVEEREERSAEAGADLSALWCLVLGSNTRYREGTW